MIPILFYFILMCRALAAASFARASPASGQAAAASPLHPPPPAIRAYRPAFILQWGWWVDSLIVTVEGDKDEYFW